MITNERLNQIQGLAESERMTGSALTLEVIAEVRRLRTCMEKMENPMREIPAKKFDDNRDTRDRMQDIAQRVNERIPEGWAFFIWVGPTQAAKPSDGRANYISNMQRLDAIHTMKEFIIKSGAGEDWMKHIS